MAFTDRAPHRFTDLQPSAPAEQGGAQSSIEPETGHAWWGQRDLERQQRQAATSSLQHRGVIVEAQHGGQGDPSVASGQALDRTRHRVERLIAPYRVIERPGDVQAAQCVVAKPVATTWTRAPPSARAIAEVRPARPTPTTATSARSTSSADPTRA